MSVSFKPDGSFTALDVPPGTYSLEGLFFARKGGRIDYDNRLAIASYEVTVSPDPQGQHGAPADVGVLEPRTYGTVDVGQVAPDVVFRTLHGRDRRLSEFGGKVILLEFWGTWCGPCVAELPNLKAIYFWGSGAPYLLRRVSCAAPGITARWSCGRPRDDWGGPTKRRRR